MLDHLRANIRDLGCEKMRRLYPDLQQDCRQYLSVLENHIMRQHQRIQALEDKLQNLRDELEEPEGV
jgi:Skp family chaperone for outer membrane proteins